MRGVDKQHWSMQRRDGAKNGKSVPEVTFTRADADWLSK